MRRTHASIRLLVLALPLAGCQPKDVPPEPAAEAPADEAAEPGPIDEVLAAMDPSADPCVDFYQYACGGWVEQAELPPDKPTIVRSFTAIRDANEAILREILDDAAADAAAGEGEESWQKLGRYYGACMDTEAIDAAGLDPLQPQLETIASLEDLDDLPRVVGKLHRAWTGVLFDMGVGPDNKNPDEMVVHVVQSGMGLPQRTYYLAEDERSQALREAYTEHVATILELTGLEPEAAATSARDILAFETELATIAWDPADLHDPEKTYNPHDTSELAALAPSFDWQAYREALDLPEVERVLVNAPPYVGGSLALANDADVEFLRAYMRFHAVRANAEQLPSEIYDAYFDFYGRTLSGAQEPRARWKRCVSATSGALRDLLDQQYVAERFAGDSKEAALDMIRGIEHAFEEGLPGLEWMDEPTRERAVEKMEAITNKIGYPDEWRDYSSLEVSEDYLANVAAWREFETLDQFSEIGGPPDEWEWFMPASAVNAYYNPSMNEIVFPAGILQPPFFGADRLDALNYGGIGMVVGHELTHGFDDDGRKFDGEGRMSEWWEPEVVERFEEAAQCVEELYDGYEYQEGMTLDGTLTLGENIADIGGLRQAYRAYQTESREAGNPTDVQGFTGEQLFFLGFAQGWCAVSRPEYEQMLAKGDSHSLPRFRVNGPASQLPEFAEAFSCEVGEPMNPADKCEVW